MDAQVQKIVQHISAYSQQPPAIAAAQHAKHSTLVLTTQDPTQVTHRETGSV